LQKTIEEAPIDDDLKDRISHKNLEALIQRFKPDWSMPEAPPKTVRVYDPEKHGRINALFGIGACPLQTPTRLKPISTSPAP
jgi:hypothetical protein